MEIEFRAWDKISKSMKNVTFIQFESEQVLLEDALGCRTINDEAILMQFTGMTDKNGKKIFDRDIVNACSEGVETIGVVQRRVDGLWIIYPAFQKNIFWGLMPNENGKTSIEVIGNKFENPELMEANR